MKEFGTDGIVSSEVVAIALGGADELPVSMNEFCDKIPSSVHVSLIEP